MVLGQGKGFTSGSCHEQSCGNNQAVHGSRHMFCTAGGNVSEESFFPPKDNSWLKMNVSKEGAVLTTAQKCVGRLWDRVGLGLLAAAGSCLLLSLVNGKSNSPLSL